MADAALNSSKSRSAELIAAGLFAIAIGLIGVLVYFILVLQERSRVASEFVVHTYQVVSCVNGAHAQFGAAQSAQRGYLLTNSKAYLDGRNNSLVQMHADLRRCGDLVVDNSRQQIRLQELGIRLKERERSFGEQVMLHQTGKIDQLTAAIEDARISSDSINALFNEMFDEESRLLRERQLGDLEQSQRVEIFLVVLAIVCILLLVAAFVTVLRSWRARAAVIADLKMARAQGAAASLQRQQLVLDSVPNAMLMVDHTGAIVYANSQLTALFGYEPEALIGQSIEVLVPERNRHVHGGLRNNYFKDPVARSMGAGRELFGLRRDGSQVPIEIGLHPLITEDGRFVLASIVDISARRREEERLRLVIEAAPSAMLMVNEQGLMTLVNSQVERLFGFAREELLGQPIEMLVPLRFRQPHAGFRARFARQPEARSMGAGRDLFGLRRDGSEVPIEIGLNPIETAEGRFVLASVIDISERKRAVDEELRRASQALAARFDETRAAALTLFNSEFDEQRVLAGTLELLAERHPFPVALYYGADALGGRLHLLAARGAPANATTDIQIGAGLVGAAAQTGRSIYVDQVESNSGITIQTGFVDIAPAALLFCPVSYRGQLLGVMALGASERLSDIDRNAVERLVAQLGAALHNIKQYANLQVLAQQLRERGEEIQSKNNQLEAASRMKSEFLANMSHELRTPLNAIIGFSEVLKHGFAGELNPEQSACMTDIFDSGQHLLSLINDILDLSKIEAGRLDLELQTIDPVVIAENGFTMLREKAMVQRVRLVSDWPASLGALSIDVRKVKQIVFNLLSNAVKFTDEGGEVRLTLRRVSNKTMEASLASGHGRLFAVEKKDSNHFLEIRVADSGIGITADDLEKLFEPFTQVDSALSRKHSGTGLGLAMVRRLTERLGGVLAVSSTVGKGSTFSVWLPWLEPLPATLESVEPITLRTFENPPLILVVEDRAQDAQLLRMQLTESGYRVLIATNAETGLELAQQERPDAIVLDVILPGMDGWEFLTRLKSHAELADIPVVIVSVTDEAQHGFVLGAANVLVKPVSQQQLMIALRGAGLLPTKPLKVLVVDDDPRTVNLISRQLQSAGFDVVTAYGGLHGISLARTEKPDLLVLDLLMPDCNGFDVIAALRAESITAAIPVLVLTAREISTMEREGLRGSVMEVLEKSEFQAADFIAMVRRVLQQE